jgi:uncharacterized RDD family membrane protein YckC
VASMETADTAEGLRIESVTGVELNLAIAGLGGRSLAFTSDFLIRTVAALAWYFAAMFMLEKVFDTHPAAAAYGYWVGLPSAAIYFLYHPVIEVLMGGRTPGKRMAGIRIVMRDGTPPGIGPLLIRNVFRLLDSLPLLYVVGIVACFITEREVRVGDMAAGTLLVYDEGVEKESVEQLVLQGSAAGLSAAQADLVSDVLARWDALDPQARLQIARQALHRLEPGATLAGTESINEHEALRRLSTLLRPVESVAAP